MQITHQTRLESYEKTSPQIGPRHKEIIDLLTQYPGGLTAWEIADKTRRMIHTVRPRLTELHAFQKLKTIGKKYHDQTQRNEAIWSLLGYEYDSKGQGVFL